MLGGGSSSSGTQIRTEQQLQERRRRLPSRYAFLDCVECHTPRLIFEHAIYQLRNPPPSQDNGSNVFPSTHTPTSGISENKAAATVSRKRKRMTTSPLDWNKCENVNEFVEWCRKICDTRDELDEFYETHGNHRAVPGSVSKHQNETRYLVLDRAERLRDTAPTLIPVLMRLQELVRLVCVNVLLILFSRIKYVPSVCEFVSWCTSGCNDSKRTVNDILFSAPLPFIPPLSLLLSYLIQHVSLCCVSTIATIMHTYIFLSPPSFFDIFIYSPIFLHVGSPSHLTLSFSPTSACICTSRINTSPLLLTFSTTIDGP